MHHYELQKTEMTKNGPLTTSHGIVALSDDARGADRYLLYRRKGFTLRRLSFQSDDSD